MNFYLKGLLTGIMMFLVGKIVFASFSAAFPAINAAYTDPVFIPVAQLFFLEPILLGFGLTWLWEKTRKMWSGSLEFGVALGVIMVVPLFFAYIGTFSFAPIVSASWSVSEGLSVIAGGMLLGALGK